MKITTLTITGADNDTNVSDIIKVSKSHPFVEWGILFTASEKLGGHRYPIANWVQGLIREIEESGVKVLLSAHFCGKYSRDVIDNKLMDAIDQLHPLFKRVQLNYAFKGEPANLEFLYDYAEKHPDREIIIQHNKGNEPAIKTILQYKRLKNINFLYDSSGGRGTEMVKISDPLDGWKTGYSGGIGPHNIKDVCYEISTHWNPAEVWIDMESKVRTEDVLDFDKIEVVVEKARRFIL